MPLRISRLIVPAIIVASLLTPIAHAQQPIQIGFLWHMHQPIYYPYENPIEVDTNGRFSFSVVDVHNQRFGPYTTWPYDAVQTASALSHAGAQVSFTGSLIENINALEAAGINGGMWNNWDWAYQSAIAMNTSLGNPRLDMVAFGYHHPLMPLLDERDIRMQIKLHKHIYGQTWGGAPYSKGMFPAETAFSTRMIPALVAEGIDWALVDNIHFDRACVNYPHTNDSSIYAPNAADQINPDPAANGGAWVQLQNLWAPSRVSAPFGYQPHYAQHVNPQTGAITKMIVVPAARYEGNEDGRGGYGAFLYDQVMDAYLPYNTDAAHPMFVVLHHDGDNYGGGSESYYHWNFQNMVSWVSSDADYDVSTVQDYLERFPPDANDVIHVESGSWAGADAGDPEFKKWLGDPDGTGWSPDRNSWAVLTAAKNRVFMADDIAPATNMQNVMTGGGSATEQAWHWLLVSQASDYWYWDGTEIWDSDVTRGCNQAVARADTVIAGQTDNTPPTIFLPQREPYNPGGYEWSASPESSDFEVWTYAYDVNGLTSVKLYWRLDLDGVNSLASIDNETYAGGAEVGAWQDIDMNSSDVAPPSGILAPTYRALRYGAEINGQTNVLIDYCVEAIDGQGNVQKSDIQHVYVGTSGGGEQGGVEIDPNPAVAGQPVTITYDASGGPLASVAQVYIHYGFNNWAPVISPDPAMTWDSEASAWTITVNVQSSATQLDMVFNDGGSTWDNNNGADWHFTVDGGSPPVQPWQLDGTLDAAASEAANSNGVSIWYGVKGDVLYVATNDAGEGNDHFLFVSNDPGAMQSAPWAKAGQVAAWSAFLADENDNDYEGWFDTSGTAEAMTGPNGGVLEGTLNLAEELGSMPLYIWLAMGPYESPDSGSLLSAYQVPSAVTADGNLTADEYVRVATVLKGDCTGDWGVNPDDIAPFIDILLGNDSDLRHVFAADMDSSGVVDGGDIQAFVGAILD